MLVAIVLSNLFALFYFAWKESCCQHRQDANKRKTAAVSRGAKRNQRPNNLHLDDPLGRLKQPWEVIEESFDLYRGLKSPDWVGLQDADEDKLVKAMNENSKLKRHCKDQIETIENLKEDLFKTMTRLAWFEEWYPKLHSAYETVIKRGEDDTEKWRIYAQEGKKSFKRLSRRHETTRERAKRWLDAASENRFETDDAHLRSEHTQGLLHGAESELRRYKSLQKDWERKTRQLEANVQSLTAENDRLHRFRNKQTAGVPLDELKSTAEMLEDMNLGAYGTGFGLSSASVGSMSPGHICSAGMIPRSVNSAGSKLQNPGPRRVRSGTVSEMESEKGGSSPFGFFWEY